MTDLVLLPPYDGPWDTTREGGVKAASGDLIGYCRFERVGEVPRMQSAARWWAASPSLVEATIALSLASRLAIGRRAPERIEEATAAVRNAQTLAIDALGRLRDPMLREGATFNAPVTEVLKRLERALR